MSSQMWLKYENLPSLIEIKTSKYILLKLPRFANNFKKFQRKWKTSFDEFWSIN